MTQFYELKVTLKDTAPVVWRRFIVPDDITLDRLHDVLQIVMGWQDQHLHSFTFKKRVFMEQPEAPNEEEESLVRLNELLKKHGNTLRYVYDFGDDWEHEIYLEDKNYVFDDMLGPIECIQGMMLCPPENCGGPAAYSEMMRGIFASKNNKDALKALKEVIEIPELDDSDVELFFYNYDVDSVNHLLSLYSRWARDRSLPMQFESDEW